MEVSDALQPWIRAAEHELPGIELFDAHTHVGEHDPDGFAQTMPELRARLTESRVAGAFTFPFHEPDGYADPNTACITGALATGEDPAGPRLVPFCRLDPWHDAVAEAERSLALGARGIKLHPRAEQFELDHPVVREIFAIANARSLPVLIHAGRGIPAGGRHLVRLCEEFPHARAILAHAGITDLAWIWRAAAALPNLLVDTSWFMPADLRAVFALMPPGQILFASDCPYGHPLVAWLSQRRIARQAGLSDAQLRLVFAGQSLRIAASEPLADGGPPVGERPTAPHLLLDRVQQFLLLAGILGFRGVPDASTEMVALARQACAVPDGLPGEAVFAAIAQLLDAYAEVTGGTPDPGDRRPLGLLMVAMAAAATPDVPVPEAS